MYIKEVLGIIATTLAFISYLPYFRDIFANKTKPHAFSWLVWSILVLIAFFGQISDNAGPGAWSTGVTTVICFLIFFLALKKGSKNIAKIDVVLLIMSGIALLLWYLTKQPVLSVILITLVDAFGFIPTLRKSWNKPYEETLSTFVITWIKHVISITALTNYSLVTALYPSYLVFANLVFISILVFRRRAIK